MNFMKISTILSSALFASLVFTATACGGDDDVNNGGSSGNVDLPDVGQIHTYKAPLYWSVYEKLWQQERDKVKFNITDEEWTEAIDWVATNLKPHGYTMICTDGFLAKNARDASGYMTHYGEKSLKELVAECKAKGLELGVYDNPLWIHGDPTTPIPGTDGLTFGHLTYNGTSPQVVNPRASDRSYKWVIAEYPGAKEYIDGFFKHFSDMGVKFIRMDFLSWYEDGKDRYEGTVGRGYGRQNYALALQYIAEAAKKYGVFTSLVMPHMYQDAQVEAKYGNMTRIVGDTYYGGWNHLSARDKGIAYGYWPNCNNMHDGFTYWSHIAGRNKVILDGDFTRLNTFTSDEECQYIISLQLMAGGPIAAADWPNTIGNRVAFYQNDEMLALNKDGFVGQPRSGKLGDKNNETWYGQMSNGDWVVGLFNRDDAPRSVNLALSDLGIAGEWNARDLWKHADEGKIQKITATIPAHGCKIVRLSK